MSKFDMKKKKLCITVAQWQLPHTPEEDVNLVAREEINFHWQHARVKDWAVKRCDCITKYTIFQTARKLITLNLNRVHFHNFNFESSLKSSACVVREFMTILPLKFQISSFAHSIFGNVASERLFDTTNNSKFIFVRIIITNRTKESPVGLS